MLIRVAMLGDIVGEPGVLAVEQQVPHIRRRWRPHLIIANAENAADGSGLTPSIYRRLRDAGIDGVTLGDHVFRRMQIAPVLDHDSQLVRPANLPRSAKGRCWMELSIPNQSHSLTVFATTVLGRVFSALPANDPFEAVDWVLSQLPQRNPIVMVEIHAEATSEKQAMGHYLDGRVVAVLGTHTHVATADAKILPKGTAYITDLGMCGPHDSIIGRQIDRVLTQMTTAMPAAFDVAVGDPRVCGVLVQIDPERRMATAIERFELRADPYAPPF